MREMRGERRQAAGDDVGGGGDDDAMATLLPVSPFFFSPVPLIFSLSSSLFG